MVGAIVLAGGQGKRMQSKVQKQYMLLSGKPLIVYALNAFEKSSVDKIVLVTGTGEEESVREKIVDAYGFSKVSAVVAGGKERYHSVYEGLKQLEDCEYVLIHDGARPMITEDIIERAIAGAKQYCACVVGMPVKDTIKIVGTDEFAEKTPERSRLWQVQTPQAFSYELIRQAYDEIMADPELQSGITDDAMVVESRTDCKVKLIKGSYENLKVTTPEDLLLAEALIRGKDGDR